MARVEIDENEYAELKRVAEVAQLIGKSPEAVRKLHEAVAIAAPDRAGPEIRIRHEVDEKLSGFEKKFDAFMEAQAKDREEREAEAARRDLEGRWLAGRKKLRDAGYNDDGIQKIEELMEKRGVADHEVAASFFEKENPPPEPAVTGNSRWDFFNGGSLATDDTLIGKLMAGDDEAFLASAVPIAIKDARGGR